MALFTLVFYNESDPAGLYPWSSLIIVFVLFVCLFFVFFLGMFPEKNVSISWLDDVCMAAQFQGAKGQGEGRGFNI